MAHARRKFVELHTGNKRGVADKPLADIPTPIDSDDVELQIRPWATGRKNWLLAGTRVAGQRAAAITCLIQSAKLNGHGPYAWLRDVLERLPTLRANDIAQLLPHRWTPAA